jgi:hypothetical protein
MVGELGSRTRLRDQLVDQSGCRPGVGSREDQREALPHGAHGRQIRLGEGADVTDLVPLDEGAQIRHGGQRVGAVPVRGGVQQVDRLVERAPGVVVDLHGQLLPCREHPPA